MNHHRFSSSVTAQFGSPKTLTHAFFLAQKQNWWEPKLNCPQEKSLFSRSGVSSAPPAAAFQLPVAPSLSVRSGKVAINAPQALELGSVKEREKKKKLRRVFFPSESEENFGVIFWLPSLSVAPSRC